MRRLLLVALLAATLPAVVLANSGPPLSVRRKWERDRTRPAAAAVIGGLAFAVELPTTLGRADDTPADGRTRFTRRLSDHAAEIAAGFAALGLAGGGLWAVRRQRRHA